MHTVNHRETTKNIKQIDIANKLTVERKLNTTK